MGMVAPQQRIASAYVVLFGSYGDVSRHAQQCGVCRQSVYRQASWLHERLQEPSQEHHEAARWRERARRYQQYFDVPDEPLG